MRDLNRQLELQIRLWLLQQVLRQQSLHYSSRKISRAAMRKAKAWAAFPTEACKSL